MLHACSPSLPMLPCSNALFLIGRVVASAVKKCAVNVGFFRNRQTSLDSDFNIDKFESESECVHDHNMIMNLRIWEGDHLDGNFWRIPAILGIIHITD